MWISRRTWMVNAFACIALPALGAIGESVSAKMAKAAKPAKVVKLVAQKFKYTPNEFEVKVGQPVVLEFTSVDFIHGFNIPDLKMRADLLPGTITKVHLTIEKPGVYDFLCDNFCGSGHEEMSGRIVARR
ncbi:MAG TPA: cupredoxin domain-containing protein [Usitatibacteraceae bacterium]